MSPPDAGWERALARALADEALFDEGVEAARNACVAGASIASAAITAAAWYDNPLTGLPALRACLAALGALPLALPAWHAALAPRVHEETGDPNHVPGFGYIDAVQATRLRAACGHLLAAQGGREHAPRTAFFLAHAAEIEARAGALNHAGLAALAFADARLDLEEAERRYLLLRMDTAIAEAQHARRAGLATFPFFSERVHYEGERPPPRGLDLASLKREVGVE